MKNKGKSLSIVFTAIIAFAGILSSLFFAREINTGLNTINSLKLEAGKAEAVEAAITKAKNELENTKEDREKLDALFIVQEETEQGVVPFLDTIEADLNQNNNTFKFISIEKDKKDESLIVFSGKSYGTFAEAFRAFQILEREVYPIEITKAILGKDENNLQFGGAWSASFQANIGAIPGIIKSVSEEEEKGN